MLHTRIRLAHLCPAGIARGRGKERSKIGQIGRQVSPLSLSLSPSPLSNLRSPPLLFFEADASYSLFSNSPVMCVGVLTS